MTSIRPLPHPTRHRGAPRVACAAGPLLLIAGALAAAPQTTPGRELGGTTTAASLFQLVDELAVANKQLRRDVAGHFETAAKGFGVAVDSSQLAFESVAPAAFAGAPTSPAPSIDDLLAGRPAMLWWSSGTPGIPAGDFTANLERDGTAVLRARDGRPVARGVGTIAAGNNTGYCEFQVYGDDVCLECDNDLQIAVCFKLP